MSKSDYIDYVRNVLGVKSIFSNEVAPAAEILKVSLLVYVQDFNSYSRAEKDLLEKMLAALKIPPNEIQAIDFNEKFQVEAKVTAYLTDQVAGQLTGQFKLAHDLAPNEIHTYSPRVLLNNVALKKAAWAELQKILLYFQHLPIT